MSTKYTDHTFFSLCLLLLYYISPVASWIQYPDTGTASLTHYEIGKNTVAACGCVGESSDNYPTAAMSQMAYGSSRAFGPACGKCFNLTLLDTWTGTPPFFPNVTKHIVVKVTDLCPLTPGGWCGATENKPNLGGQFINFDLAYPSSAISNNFFPSDVSLYGYADFGVWNVSYQAVDCSNWAGWKNTGALGSVANQGPDAVCCPANPTNSSNTCPSYSDHNGIAPDTTTQGNTSPSLLIPILHLYFLLPLVFWLI